MSNARCTLVTHFECPKNNIFFIYYNLKHFSTISLLQVGILQVLRKMSSRTTLDASCRLAARYTHVQYVLRYLQRQTAKRAGLVNATTRFGPNDLPWLMIDGVRWKTTG